MGNTATGIQAEQTVTQFANGKQLEYTLEDYDNVPKCDRREFVSRLIIANARMKESVEEHNKRLRKATEKAEVNSKAFFMQAEQTRGIKAEYEAFKKSFWYRVYRFFA